MNGENKYLKIFYICAFLAFAAVSCWATAESLRMLLPSWHPVFCYIVTIGFFFIASYGTKMMVDSFNPHIYFLGSRKLRFAGGLFIVIVFWLICSMPTNTHTFFYRNVANGIAKNDIARTNGYLDALTKNTKIEGQIRQRQAEVENQVKSKLTDLENEIKNDLNPGFGPNAEAILREFANMLDVPTVAPISFKKPLSVQGRKRLVDQYRKKIYALLETRKQNIANSMLAVNTGQYKKEAKTASENLRLIENEMNSDPSAINEIDFAHEVDNRLLKGYALINTYSEFVNFKEQEEKERYTASKPITEIKRLMSVIDVWKDLLKGKYKGFGFVFWIIVSILVDIAAFIFFDLTFKNDEY